MATYSWATFQRARPNPTKRALSPVEDYFGRTPAAAESLRPISLPKVPGADPLIYDSFNRTQGLGKTLFGDAKAYRETVGGTQPLTSDFTREELADISRVYDPAGYESSLAQIRGRRENAMRNLSGTILEDMRRTLGLNRVGSGGTAGTGLGSYLTRAAGSEAARVRAGEAVDSAAQARADLAAIMAARQASQGRRQQLLDANLQRILLPTQTDTEVLGRYNAQLAQALQQALANSTYAWGMQYA